MADPGLETFCDEARAAWPQLEVDRGVFERFVIERIGDARDGRHGGDLYLACACTLGNPRAIELADAKYIASLAPALARVTGEAEIPDILQTVRLRFFVGEPPRAPRIGEYDGSARLGTWLRVAAVRLAISKFRKTWREAPGDGIDALAEAPGPELELIAQRYGSEFRAAFQAGFAALSPRDRNLVRQQVLDRLGIDQLALLYGIHRATAARWFAQAQERLITNVRSELQTRLHIDADQLDSIFQLLQSKLEITVRLFLTNPPG
jgi:RNA polymerase sigma-70 factor (ECF subfamily)